MIKLTLRNISRAAALSVIFLSGVLGFLYMKNHFEPVAPPSGWAKDISLGKNNAGIFCVHDEASKKLLFDCRADQPSQPVSIEKRDDKTWSVIFKKVR